jgi:hemoglobin-like flavoprotein
VAVRALQAIRDSKVDELIAERLLTDSASDVRISALSAAKVRQPTDILAGAVQNAAANAEDPHVRYRAVELLATWIDTRPDVRPTLEQIAQNDVELRIRDRAQSAL